MTLKGVCLVALRGGDRSLPTEKSTFWEALVTVLSEVEPVLAGLVAEEWQKALVRSLASAMDDAPNASIAKELRLLMAELGASDAKPKGDVSDDLAAKRAARRAAS